MDTQEEARVRTFVNGTPINVDPRSIDRELTALWAAAREGVDDGKAVVRFSTLNLIVTARNEAQAERLSEEITKLTSNYPCRAILLHTNEAEGQPTLSATVAAHCRPTSDGKVPVCGEQIDITASGENAAALLPGTVIPLLTADLPVVLGWPDWPNGAVAADGWSLEPNLFRPLLQSCDQLLVDSLRFNKPNSQLVRLEALREQDFPTLAVTDLNWLRLTAWRQMVAQVFDAPTMRPYLANLTRIELRYATKGEQPPNPCQALLFIGWLSAKLGWRPSDISPQEAGNSTITLTAGGSKQVYVGLLTTPAANIPPGNLAEVVLVAEYRGLPASFRLTRIAWGDDPNAAANHVRTTIEVQGQNRIERTVQMGDQDWVQMVISGLGNLGHDSTFEQALQLAVWLGRTSGTKKIDKGVRGDR